MSRLIVKELTKNINEHILNGIFSSYGKITDIKIFKNKIGKSRNFCFIGFSDPESAKKAIQSVNGTFIQKKKVIVCEALPNSNKVNTERKKSTCFQYKKKDSVTFTEDLSETGILCIKNIPNSCKIGEIKSLFENFGHLEFIKIPSKKNKNFAKCAYLKFILPEYAINAAIHLDGTIFQGRIIQIVSGYKHFKNNCISTHNSMFNAFKEINQNLEFKKFLNHKSWFLLFIPQHVIIDNMVLKFGNTRNLISDYKRLNISIGQQIISEGRLQNEAFLILKKEGINLKKFNPYSIDFKSRTTILIKNFPIRKKKSLDLVLKNLGDLVKYVILPFTGLILIEFENETKAQLAYNIIKGFKNKDEQILIQWAPFNCFKKNEKKSNPRIVTKNEKKQYNLQHYNQENSLYINYIEEKKFLAEKKLKRSYKILLRNLPFSIKSEDVKHIFTNLCNIISIRIPIKKDGHNRGFGFVELTTLDEAKKAIILIQNIHIGKRHIISSILL
jgi:RNA recognition motif-containing protein